MTKQPTPRFTGDHRPGPDFTGQPADQALKAAVITAVHDAWCKPDCHVPGHPLDHLSPEEAQAAITAVRQWDAEQAWRTRAAIWHASPIRPCAQPLGHHGGCR